MTTHNSNTPDSGLIELSKIRESIVDASEPQHKELDRSLLSEHVPVLRAPQPRRSRMSALGMATAASVLLGLTSAAYALHHQVTQHMTVGEITRSNPSKPSLEATAFVTPQPVVAPESVVAPEPVLVPGSLEGEPESVEALIATTTTPRLRARNTSRRVLDARAPSSTERSIDELLHSATGGQVPEREGATRPAESTLPVRPARAHVSSSFRGVTRAVQACGAGAEGVVSARASVDGASGRVRSVSLSGVSGEAERCIERALMGVRLDPFQQAQLEITFPYRL